MKMEFEIWAQTVIVAVYAPKDDSAKTVKVEFKDSLATTLNSIG